MKKTVSIILLVAITACIIGCAGSSKSQIAKIDDLLEGTWQTTTNRTITFYNGVAVSEDKYVNNYAIGSETIIIYRSNGTTDSVLKYTIKGNKLQLYLNGQELTKLK